MMRILSLAALFLCAAAPSDFDIALFKHHVGELNHTIVQSPSCVGHEGVHGSLVMETPQQAYLPFSVTTIVGPRGIYSSLTTTGDDSLSEADAEDVGGVFNDQAEKIVTKIIADCKGEDT